MSNTLKFYTIVAAKERINFNSYLSIEEIAAFIKEEKVISYVNDNDEPTSILFFPHQVLCVVQTSTKSRRQQVNYIRLENKSKTPQRNNLDDGIV